MKVSSSSTIVPSKPLSAGDAAVEQQLVDALAEYHEAADSGRPLDRDAFLAKYSDIQSELVGYLDSIDLIRAIAPQLGDGADRTKVDLTGRATLGDFQIIREIGRGGMGVVYEANQASLGRRVALKVLPFAAMLKSQQLDRFRNEVRAAASLDHPNIVAVYSVGNDRGVHFYAMQLIEGHTLAELAAEPHEDATDPAGGSSHKAGRKEAETDPIARLSTLRTINPDSLWKIVANYGLQAAEALDHAHRRGVIHRDVKPANLLIDGNERLWVADFGLARLEADAGMTASGDLLGTLRYMSPEQAAGDRAVVDHRSDIYSLGVTLYELLAECPAFESKDRQQLIYDVTSTSPPLIRKADPRIPEDLETIVAKAMEKDPIDRYSTAAEMAADLQNFIEHRPIAARAPSIATRVRKWARRRPKVVAAAFAAMLLATIGSAIAAVLVAGANQRAQIEKSNAESNLRVAVETIDKLLSRVGEDAQAHGQLRHADELLRDAVASYDTLLTDSDDPQLIVKAASAHAQLCELLGLGADFGEAFITAEKGLVLLQKLPDEVYEAEQSQQVRASLLSASGTAKLNMHDYAAAEWSLREALAIHKQLFALRPDDVSCRKDLLLSHNSLGTLLMYAEQLDEAEKEYRTAEALCQTLPIAEQDAPLGLNRLAGLKANLAMIAVRRRDYAAAETDFHTAVESQRSAVRGLPSEPSMREDLYKFRWNLADVLVRAERHQDAMAEVKSISEEFPERLQAHVEGVWLLVRCIEQNPGGDHEGFLEVARQLIARTQTASFAPLRLRKDLAWLLATCPSKALRDGERSARIAKQLCREDVKNAMYQCVLSAAYLEIAEYDMALEAAEMALSMEGHGGSVYEFVLLSLASAGQNQMEISGQWREKARAAHRAIGDHLDDGLKALVAEVMNLSLQGVGS